MRNLSGWLKTVRGHNAMKTRKIHTILVLAAVIVTFTLLVCAGVTRADTGTWTQGEMPVLSVGPPTDNSRPLPCSPSRFTYSAYYNAAGTPSDTARQVTTNGCVTSNGMGQFGDADTSTGSEDFMFIKPGTAFAYRILDPTGREKGLRPVPNQSAFVYADPIGLYGDSALRIMDGSFAQYGDFGVYGYGSGIQKREIAYKMRNTIPAWLKNAAGEPILFHTRTFSNNGEWLVGSTNYGFIRVNIKTKEMLVFSNKTFQYGLGFTPAVGLAISDDGMTVINYGDAGGEIAVYDLSGCAPAPVLSPATANLATGCQKRILNNSLQAQDPSFSRFNYLRFSADGKSISGKAQRNVAPAGSTPSLQLFSMTYTVAGYQPVKTAYLALGDSFSSGGGTYDYEQGTNQYGSPRNTCHLSKKSYPYLAANALGISSGEFHSVACSGAKTSAYYAVQDKQEKNVDSPLFPWLPGYQSQQEAILNSENLNTVTISMIGNDIGFSNKITRCIAVTDSCFHYREDRESIAQEIFNKYDTLVKLYQDIRQDSGGAKVYVLGYPQLFSAENNCAPNAPLDAEERAMSRGLVGYLDAVIKSAAGKAGVQYIDVENAFAGHELCADGKKAVNGLVLGNDMPISRFGIFGSETFHPNTYGHELMSQALLAQSENLTKAMPESAAASTPPYIGSATYAAFVDSAPATGNILKRTAYTTLGIIGDADVVFNTSTFHVAVPDALKPGGIFEAWFNSTPTYAGSLTADVNGKLEGDIAVPAGITPGIHTLHIYGQNMAGETLDMSRTVYVAASESDADGDGIPNQNEKCLAGNAANLDQDRDGIDDACDADITDPLADTTPPVVTGIPDTQPNAAGWYTTGVTINWHAEDPQPSSGDPIQPPATVVADEGEHRYTSAPSCDLAGNCATGQYTVKIDKTAPTIEYQVSSAPSADGWYNKPVTVTFICDDQTSSIAACSEPVTVSAGNAVVTGYATDRAGNVSGINVIVAIDTGKPTVHQTASPSGNVTGWHNTDVKVSTTCEDDESGIASCSPDTLVATEGSNQPVKSISVDRAGNTNEATTFVSIDKTPPALGVLSWASNPKPVDQTSQLTVASTDILSGIVEAEYFLGDTDPGQGNGATMSAGDGVVSTVHGTDFPTGVYKVSVRAKDAAGNWSPVVSDYLVVYNPTGVRMTGKRTLIPALANGDILPGLVVGGQTDAAKFGFNVRYDSNGQIHKSSDFQFSYQTGTKCNKPAVAQNCHTFDLNATSINWLTAQGSNNGVGIFQGAARLVVDGAESNVQFRLTGQDGERLGTTAKDRLTLKIYRLADDPNTAAPLYCVDGDVERGNIRIRTSD